MDQNNQDNQYEEINDNYLTPLKKNIGKIYENIQELITKKTQKENHYFDEYYKNNLKSQEINSNFQYENNLINKDIEINNKYLQQAKEKIEDYNKQKQLFLNKSHKNKRVELSNIEDWNEPTEYDLRKYLTAKYNYKMLKENKKIIYKKNKPKKFGLSLFINI